MKFETGKNGSLMGYMGKFPKIDPSVFMCEGVCVIGDVEIAEDCSLWYNVVVRGDVNYVRIGARTNIQDLALVHVTHHTYPTIIEEDVSIGHGAMIHGCTLKKGCLIGIGAKVLDGAVVGEGSLVAAGAVVREGAVIPPNTLVAGVPAKIIRELTAEDKARVSETVPNYMQYVANYRSHESTEIRGEGTLEIMANGFGFLRNTNLDNDIYVSQAQIQRFNFVAGDVILGQVRPPNPQKREKVYSLIRTETINGKALEE